MQENKTIKYYAGIFKRFDTADISLRKIKELGFKEAFLVAFYTTRKFLLTGKRIREKGIKV